MAADVIRRIFSGAVTNGNCVTGVTMTGQYKYLTPNNEYVINASGISDQLDTRFDDTTYYST